MIESSEQFVRRMLARPKQYRVVTIYRSGARRVHEVHSEGQAQNHAIGERRKVGRDLIDRETGKRVHVVDVRIERI